MPPIAGKSVVVTGGSRGVGRGLVEKLLARGNRVIATSRRSPDDADPSLAALVAAHGGRLTLTQLDTAVPGSIAAWAAGLSTHTPHVDVLINNAGVYGRRLALAEFEADDFTSVFQTNAVGPFLVVQQLLKHGLLGPPGSLVVNVSSVMASHGDAAVSSVTPGGYAYRASKAALNIINKALALDLRDQQVDCVCVHPGYVQTDMTGGAGWVTVDESTTGLLALLEDGRPLNGRWYGYDGAEIPW
ncbi:csgA [Scenedesmus sp. PABB004]|nr:csgA [Scenedesmus sp. PABB004]